MPLRTMPRSRTKSRFPLTQSSVSETPVPVRSETGEQRNKMERRNALRLSRRVWAIQEVMSDLFHYTIMSYFIIADTHSFYTSCTTFLSVSNMLGDLL